MEKGSIADHRKENRQKRVGKSESAKEKQQKISDKKDSIKEN